MDINNEWTIIVPFVEANLGRALIGTLIGGTIGFLLGVSNGVFKVSHRVSDTTIQMIRNVPHLALVPLVIIWMGVDEGAKIFLVTHDVREAVRLADWIILIEDGYISMNIVNHAPRPRRLSDTSLGALENKVLEKIVGDVHVV